MFDFQTLMPIIGWFLAKGVYKYVETIDHWIAFGLLAFIGGKMVYDGAKSQTEKPASDLRLHTLLVLAVATSIDALMVGFSFAFLQTPIAVPVAVIGAVTFALCFVGFYFGCGIGKRFGHRIKIVGGIVLILIGLRILLEHLLA